MKKIICSLILLIHFNSYGAVDKDDMIPTARIAVGVGAALIGTYAHLSCSGYLSEIPKSSLQKLQCYATSAVLGCAVCGYVTDMPIIRDSAGLMFVGICLWNRQLKQWKEEHKARQ